MRRGRLLAEARKRGEGLIVKKDKGSSTAFERFKCSYVASECLDKVQGLEEKMGSFDTEVKGLHADVSAMHKGMSTWWSTADKYMFQDQPLIKKKLASLHEDMKGLRAAMRDYKMLADDGADMSKMYKLLWTCLDAHKEFLSADLKDKREQAKKMEVLKEEMEGLRADVVQVVLAALDKMDSMQEEMTGLKANVTKVGCQTAADVASSVLMLHKRIDLLPCTKGLSADMGSMDRLLTGLRADVAKMGVMMREKQTASSDLVMKYYCANMAGQDANTDNLKKMHAEMERLCGLLATMNGNANGVWSNVIAQEKGIEKTQKLMDTLLSNVESYTADKDRANVVLVKIVGAFLACTTAFYAWIVWSFNSCYL